MAKRTFDHDECKKLRDEGATIASLMKRYGKARTTIMAAVDPVFAEKRRQENRDDRALERKLGLR